LTVWPWWYGLNKGAGDGGVVGGRVAAMAQVLGKGVVK
jgi:hypothetical protein